ncbi:MAG: hypothetical protein A3B89_02975 [Candidatus Buchananbacteria bacterium RIFCSPHIGHO2_02_FULL_40_13]|uniref:Uncharacterized protein n=1 Tax=Candidatus Buchananbacteria bacterium RIFCSPLOWO2_01_FULL_39_33 TaxID=1797543 RepID=A0A1G1YHK5_9BACT|nr:MAG: hypothetical protein A3B89_02975 [Candidatus Buchananbacteria bacterium RIFCSPHIGHO2_02_FULL_40_13]OGY51276.1 MAG: hypothetical protein A3A02_01545 [Candidatus Buchananbacteria bacterium RIFCSPLOWO2_01_FULL_39_33]
MFDVFLEILFFSHKYLPKLGRIANLNRKFDINKKGPLEIFNNLSKDMRISVTTLRIRARDLSSIFLAWKLIFF